MDRNETTLIKAIETTYFEHLCRSYADWTTPAHVEKDHGDASSQRIVDFADGLSYTKGRKYIKIISSRHGGNKSVHSFIVLKPTKGYEIGDILKAATWNAPATNFKRGNVFELWSLPAIRWTGC